MTDSNLWSQRGYYDGGYIMEPVEPKYLDGGAQV